MEQITCKPVKLSKLGGPLFLIALVAFLASPTTRSASAAPARERVSFNADWRFVKGDPADAGDQLSYNNIKDWGNATGPGFTTNSPAKRPEGNLGDKVAYTQPGFNDTSWRPLSLPHDWGVEG